MRRPLQLAALLVLLGSSCSKVSGPSDTVRQGVWGGDGIQMTVTATGASIDYGCDAGTVDEPLTFDLNGRSPFRAPMRSGVGVPGKQAILHRSCTRRATRERATAGG